MALHCNSARDQEASASKLLNPHPPQFPAPYCIPQSTPDSLNPHPPRPPSLLYRGLESSMLTTLGQLDCLFKLLMELGMCGVEREKKTELYNHVSGITIFFLS
jgi:hypothetical protein